VELRLPEIRHNEFYQVKLTALEAGEDPSLVGLPVGAISR